MRNVDGDIRRFNRLINGCADRGCDKLYYCSNERLDVIFSYIDLNDKDVLTVLGSGDQAFYCYNKGAQHIDLFDKNRFTFYYYYLRRWFIQYRDLFYPRGRINARSIKRLLKDVNPSTNDEKSAYDFWMKCFDRIDCRKLMSAFYSDMVVQGVSNSLKDLDFIKTKFHSDSSEFYHMNMGDKTDIDKKYDVVITSNIAEYLRQSPKSLICYCDNLEKLLNDNGMVIASNLMGSGIDSVEKRIFEKKFEIEALPETLSWGKRRSPGYLCVKK